MEDNGHSNTEAKNRFSTADVNAGDISHYKNSNDDVYFYKKFEVLFNRLENKIEKLRVLLENGENLEKE